MAPKKSVKKDTPKTADEIQYRMAVLPDIHLRRVDPLGVVGKDGVNTRLSDKLTAIKTIVDYSVKNNVTHVVFLGDIFDSINPSEKIRELFWEAVSPILDGRQIRILLGNHDRTGQAHNLASERYTMGANVKVISQPFYEPLPLDEKKEDFGITHMPFLKRNLLMGYLDTMSTPMDILFGHFEIAGADLAPDNMEIREGLDRDILNAKARLIWLGHIHKHQEFRPGFGYLGSLVQCDFGEIKTVKVFGALTVTKDGRINYEYHPIPQREMIQIEVNEADSNNLYTSSKIPAKIDKEGALVKAVFKGSREWLRGVNKAKFRRRFSKALRVLTEDAQAEGKKSILLQHGSVAMEEHVQTYNRAQKKGDEHLKIGLELAKEVQEADL